MSIINKKILLLVALATITAISGTSARLNAQQRPGPVRTSDLSDEDWNSWRIGVITSEEADKAYTSQNYTNAIALYEKAIDLLKSVQKNKPSWNKKGIASRLTQLEQKKQSALRRKADQDLLKNQTAGDLNIQQQIAAANADAVAQISELKLALEDAQKKILRYKENLEQAKKTAQQVSSLMNEKEKLEKQHTLLLIQYNALQEKAASGEINQATKAAYEEAKKRGDALAAELKNIQTQMEQFKKNAAELTQQNSDLNKKNSELQNQLKKLAHLETDIANLQNKIKADSGDFTRTKEQNLAEVNRLKQALAKKSQEADQANEALVKLRASMNLNDAARQLEQAVATLKAENSKLQQEQAKLASELAAAKKQIADDAETIAKTGALARNLTEQNRLLSADIEKAKKMIAARSAEMQKLTSELNLANTELARLRKERDAFAQEIVKKPVEGSTSTAAELAQAKALLKALNTDNERLKQAQTEAKKQTESFKKQIASLEKTTEESAQKLKTAKAELEALLKKDSALKKATEKTTELEKQLAAADSRIKQLDAALNSANSKLASSSAAQTELKQLKEKYAALEKALSTSRKEAADQKKLIESAKMFDVEKLKKQVIELSNDYNAAKKKMDELTKLTASTVQIENELRALRETIILLETEKAALVSEKNQMQQTIAYHERKAKEYETSAGNDALTRSLLQENKILKVELENAKNIKPDEKFAAELAAAKETISNYQSELQKNLAEYAAIKNGQLELRLNIVALEKELKTLQQENAKLKENPAASEALKKQQAVEAEKKALQDKITENDHKIASLETLLDSLKKEQTAQIRVMELLKKENENLKQKLKDASPALKALEEKVAAAEKTAGDLVKQNDDLKRENRALKAQIEKAIADAGKVNINLKDAAGNVAAAQKAAQDLQTQNSLLKSENERLKKQLTELNEALKKAQTKPAEVKAVTVVDTKVVDELKKQNAELQTKLADARKAASASPAPAADTAKVKKLADDLAKIEGDLTKARTEIAAKDQQITKLQNDLKNMRETMDKLAKDSSAAAKADLAKLQEQNLKLNETIRSLQNEKTTAGENLIQTKKELLSVKAQLEKLRSEVTADVKGKKLAADLDAMTEKAKKLEKEHSTLQVTLEQLKQEKNKLTAQNTLLEKQLDSALRKITLLQAEIQKWSAGNDAVVKGKVAEKDKVIDQIMKEHMAQAHEIERLKTALEDAETLAAAARKDAINAREALDELKEKLRKDSGKVTATVSTGIRITPAGKKAETTQSAASIEKTAIATPEEKKTQLAPDVLKKYSETLAEAEKLEKEKNDDKAMWKYLIAADLNPEDWKPHMAMSRLYLKAEKAAKAKQKYEKALRLGMKRNPEHEKALSDALQKAGK